MLVILQKYILKRSRNLFLWVAVFFLFFSSSNVALSETFFCVPDRTYYPYEDYDNWKDKYGIGSYEVSEVVADPFIINLNNDEITNVTYKTFFYSDGTKYDGNKVSADCDVQYKGGIGYRDGLECWHDYKIEEGEKSVPQDMFYRIIKIYDMGSSGSSPKKALEHIRSSERIEISSQLLLFKQEGESRYVSGGIRDFGG